MVGPLTQPPTEEQRILKQQQIKAKGVSRGPSKLLSKFMPDEHRKVKFLFLIEFLIISLNKKDAPKSPGNKDKTPKKTISPAAKAKKPALEKVTVKPKVLTSNPRLYKIVDFVLCTWIMLYIAKKMPTIKKAESRFG